MHLSIGYLSVEADATICLLLSTMIHDGFTPHSIGDI